MEFVNLNGIISEKKDLKIGFSNRSFRYGDGLFETMKVMNGRVLFRLLHYSRLIMGMHVLKLEIPDSFSIRFFDDNYFRLLEKYGVRNGTLRMNMHRTGKGLYKPDSDEADFLIEYFPSDAYYYNPADKGLKLGVYRDCYKPLQELSKVKTNNSIPYVLASKYAKEQGFDDCIVLNENGNIADCTSSNLFLFDGENLVTPSSDQGGVDGVMKRVLIKVARKSGMNVVEKEVNPQDLNTAKEVFLTNVIRGISWISEFEGSNYSNEISSILVSKLNEKVLDEMSAQ